MKIPVAPLALDATKNGSNNNTPNILSESTDKQRTPEKRKSHGSNIDKRKTK